MGYYYRALNDKDISKYNNRGTIQVQHGKQITDMKCLRYVTSHISNGSEEKSAGCWISASKNFGVCAEEFSVPQNGKFNTAQIRKPIAVIESLVVRNYTYLSGVDIKNNPIKINLVGQPTVTIAIWKQQTNCMHKIDTFVLDFSYPPESIRRTRNIPLSEFSYSDLVHQGVILNKDNTVAKRTSSYSSGMAYRSREILVLNEIPRMHIKKVLSFIEIDILYAIHKSNTTNSKIAFDSMLNQMITSPNHISNAISKVENSLSGFERWLYNKLYTLQKTIHEISYYLFSRNMGTRIQLSPYHTIAIYSQLKNIKRSIVSRFLNQLGHTLDTVAIIDDEIDVAVYDDTQGASIPTGQSWISVLGHQIPFYRQGITNYSTRKNFYDIVLMVNQENRGIIKYDKKKKQFAAVNGIINCTKFYSLAMDANGNEIITSIQLENFPEQ
jgi:hypothetical protein